MVLSLARKRVVALVGSMALVAALAGATTGGGDGPDSPSVPSTLADFYGPGSQEGQINISLQEAHECTTCHSDFDIEREPYRPWAASMMGQGGRDPIFWAALAVAEQAAPFVGDLCIRCHVPRGWIEGRSQPTGGGALTEPDYEGVSCSVCHRMVDPVFEAGVSPAIDQKILGGIAQLPVDFHSAQYVIDPEDRRRGPFQLSPTFWWHAHERSPFHQETQMCATCHDVSNPLFTMNAAGEYVLNDLGAPHPSHRKYEQFPLERTWSEWANSEFALHPVPMGGRFGGNKAEVSTCQDCHMPDATGTACAPGLGGLQREDLPLHDFRGATTWMLQAVRNLYPDAQTGLSTETVAMAIERNEEMMRRASDAELTTGGNALRVRIINQTGHKLPTGHLEGRRMWIHARFYDGANQLLAEFGAYDFNQATLNAAGTRVYEAHVGLDEAMANLLGVPAGPSHLFPLNNKFYLDNRIPPRGFTNAAYAAAQCAPVGHAYTDGQYWDDTRFIVPPGAARARVVVYYQTITREAVEGLRDANHTNNAGQVLYEQWLATGKSAPLVMDDVEIDLTGFCAADFNADGARNVRDFVAFQTAFATGRVEADYTNDGAFTIEDYTAFLAAFGAGCP